MIEIIEQGQIDGLYERLRKIELELNGHYNGKKARITCIKYRSKYKSGSARGAVLKGKWIEIEQVRISRGNVYFKGRLEDRQGKFTLALDHPFKADQLEIA